MIVSAGNNELNFHVKLPSEQMKEGSFKVTRMRCWRVTSSVSGFASSGTVWGRESAPLLGIEEREGGGGTAGGAQQKTTWQ